MRAGLFFLSRKLSRRRWKMSRKSERHAENRRHDDDGPPYYDREEPGLTDEHVNSRAKALIPWLGGVFVGVLLVLGYLVLMS
jgi:hypothetical protein